MDRQFLPSEPEPTGQFVEIVRFFAGIGFAHDSPMSTLPTTASLGVAPSWDGEGRRIGGGALAADPPAIEGEDQLSFSDFLSIINPLQHLPIVSSVYRWVTGDTIKPAARVIGGALYGGPIGLATAALSAVVEQVKGADIGAQLLAMVAPDSSEPAKATEVAGIAPGEAQGDTPGSPALDNAANMAALRQLAADLRSIEPEPVPPKPPPEAMAAQPGQGRTIAFYQANAGRKLAPVDSGRNSVPQRHGMSAPTHLTAFAPPAPKPADGEKRVASEPANQPDGPPSAWFSAAMMRGLDRYRAAQRLDKTDPQLDLSH
jgi:hypothetical protein